MSLRLDFADEAKNVCSVYYCNGVYVGEFYREVSGHYVYDPDRTKGGYWSEGMLIEIAEELQRLNKPWDDQINQYFDTQNSGATPKC